ncbi:uncharacterized protein MYCFIDRAFT_78368 [Pseudocercospora fijiensis CIRAD86]|uniref:Uncharacterized protein n=1 Tax=Pseudocercospora fijiensis (strain CIRAD86) TaxID=383855 RepID=M2YLP5_PSEFD|nr:uncharacterized protein MYCFIDRAFT_78368 [Pseudocercospora fijiensis CIRAD86]EME78660.1 hypothetical protein MYCFIDRAFT_78368 [Pseudocercospora fijiensis CIRAD86]
MDEFPTYPDLRQKVALVMGIGQTTSCNPEAWGNGAAIALRLSQNDAFVFGCDLDMAAAERTKSRLPGPCTVMAADVTSATDVSRVVDTCISTYGRIDILINNVGFPVQGDAVSLHEGLWNSQLHINLNSVYLACQKVIPIMQEQGCGSIVNNSSIAGLRYLGKPQIAYNTAKAAVMHFTRVTAAAFAKDGVRLNCVAPGLILTPLVEAMEFSPDEGKREMFRKVTEHNVPMGHMGTPFDVADAAVFLASAAAKYITGHTIVVDGGLTVSTGT